MRSAFRSCAAAPSRQAEATQPGGPAVAIIDEVLAKKLWPEGDALGQHLQLAGTASVGPKGDSGDLVAGEGIEIVGIVPAVRHAVFEKQPGSALYLPFARGFQNNAFFFVRFKPGTHPNEAATADLLRRSVREVDPALPVLSLKSFDAHLNDNLELWMVRAAAALFSVFGVLALGLSIVGLYGVKAYSVARRTREIGIRMALGAQRATVQRMILREGAAMLTAGLGFGLLLALATGRLVSSMLYEVSAVDPIAFTVAPLVLAIAGLLATWVPGASRHPHQSDVRATDGMTAHAAQKSGERTLAACWFRHSAETNFRERARLET
jgi:hypothetical protein